MDDRGTFTLSTYFKQKRLQKKLTQTEVANRTGLTAAYISLLENGKKKNPSPAVIKKLAKVLSISNIEVMKLLEFIADSSNDEKETEEPVQNLHFFDITGLSEKDIQHIQETIELLKIRAEYEKNKNG
ncbi:helix-turn-helix domain-containing protein [Bacillus atrophaeus]|uniref:helix-turn-helix domain-containing protein n=1 Tax=Bacillus atrophaeus TaxID=1452 RepID=UPI00077A33D1|nr:helix-turn-helix domain-containing protein [Bacillus atrophaeus]KXZ13293.1 hypothetical protein AXI57_16185 [Bacillus atrophaeus]MED4806296.1 helix-turn-helix domain-containing protein [Bacillus atrophaeus]UFD97587.1 Conjugation repressor Rco [Bacillus atrophaeus]GED04288.1 hypothetical protein BAT02nite_39320 [Bacillus atrophaeus]